jgi:excisionase family DNA binding protein
VALTDTPVADADDLHVYSVPETVQRLRISRTGLYKLIQSGELPFVKIGARRVVRAGDLRKYLESL